MRNLFEQPKQKIAAHTEQRDDLTLVVRCKSEEIAIVLKLIESTEETSTPRRPRLRRRLKVVPAQPAMA